MYLPPRGKPDFPPAPSPTEGQNFTVDKDLRSWLETNEEVVTTITKPVQVEHIGAISAQSEGPVVFENIVGKPGFRVVDTLVKHRNLQARALGVAEEDFPPPSRTGCASHRAASSRPVPVRCAKLSSPATTSMYVNCRFVISRTPTRTR